MKVALCQTRIEWENKETNYERAEVLIREAVREEAELIFFPEMSFTGFSMNIEATKEWDCRTIETMAGFAGKYRIAIGFGWVKACGEKAENHYTVVDKSGNILSDYIKIHSFSYGGEEEQFLSGGSISQFVFKGFCFTPFICYDLRFPEVFRLTAQTTDVFVIPANWPTSRTAHWDVLLRARAIENQSYVLGINCVGDIGGQRYSGNSAVIEPDGKTAACVSGVEEVIYATIDRQKMRVREDFNVMRDQKKELYAEIEKHLNFDE